MEYDGLQFQISYTFSKAIDDNIDSTGEFEAFRPTRMDLERSVSIFDITHNFVVNAVARRGFVQGFYAFEIRGECHLDTPPRPSTFKLTS